LNPAEQTEREPVAPGADAPSCYALLGNPNTGKTTVFNRLCGIRAKTANFPGSTVEARVGSVTLDHGHARIVDLPGLYGLNLDRPESRTCKDYLAGRVTIGHVAEAIIVVADATNLRRNLIFVSQALHQGLPVVVALNMMDEAQRQGIEIDVDTLTTHLGCPVVPVCARTGTGFPALRAALAAPRTGTGAPAAPDDVDGAQRWAAEVANTVISHGDAANGNRFTDRLDAVCTHPVLGLVVFATVMTGLFYTIFVLATVPMDLIELVFAHIGTAVGSAVPPGAIHDLLVDGVVSGIAGTLVFLPQICLLFFLISVLEDTGYLARAVFVTDRILRRFGLPGQAFVPLLSAHACAIPAIMSARLIPDRRDRIATVLVAPFMSCSARLPVYVLLVGILFDDALSRGLAFTGCYVLGAAAALVTSLLVLRSVLRGVSAPMVMELPRYRLPSLRTALTTTLDRAVMFLRKAGTVILAICIVLWWLSAYPRVDEPPAAELLRTQAAAIETVDAEAATRLEEEADVLASRHAMSASFAGRLGRAVSPVFEPIGLDWQLTIGVVTSFAAREVFVSTLAVIFAGTDDAESGAVLELIRTSKRDDGTTDVFTPATAASLLVFYVLAMQCLPTLPVTAREAGHWGWALLQLAYMSAVAWCAAFLVFQGMTRFGGG
jgi:ferrous iron transport protein B